MFQKIIVEHTLEKLNLTSAKINSFKITIIKKMVVMGKRKSVNKQCVF